MGVQLGNDILSNDVPIYKNPNSCYGKAVNPSPASITQIERSELFEMEKEYQIDPVAKPRQTRADVWKKRTCVIKYRDFADKCRALGMKVPVSGAHITFVIAMPKSWSKKKMAAMDGTPHQQIPDIDNLAKAIFDALYENDSCIWDVRITKLWGRTGKIFIKENRHNVTTQIYTR